jgi:hypothetical protein
MCAKRKLATTVPPGLALLGLAAFGWYSWSPASSTAHRSLPPVARSIPVTVPSLVLPDVASPSLGGAGSLPAPVSESSPPGSAGSLLAPTSGSFAHRRTGRTFVASVAVPLRDSVNQSQVTSDEELPEDEAGTTTSFTRKNTSEVADRQSVSSPTLPLPLPMAALDPTPAMPTSEPARATLDGLQQGFLAALAVPAAADDSLDAAETARRWRLAQPASDQMFELFYGSQAYMAQQMQQHLVQQAMAALAP